MKTVKATGHIQYICTACKSTCTSITKKIVSLDKDIKSVGEKAEEN